MGAAIRKLPSFQVFGIKGQLPGVIGTEIKEFKIEIEQLFPFVPSSLKSSRKKK